VTAATEPTALAPARFESSVDLLMPVLLAYFLRRLPNREDAADALSETLVVLWRKRSQLPSDEAGFRRYSFGVARHVLKEVQRGRVRQSEIADRLKSQLHQPEAYTQARGDIDLERALNRLSTKERELVLLVAWEGFSVSEAAQVIGIRADAARARYSRARARLRSWLD
jgi:RNA polymerase sigma-70 factor, ECF subfamily